MQGPYPGLWPRREAVPVAVALLLLGSVLLPRPAGAEVDAGSAAARVRTEFNVEVLNVRAGEIDQTPVWFVTVMKPGGNSNDAFQVTTLAVDKATGQLVPVFRHGPTGPVDTGQGALTTGIDRRPDVLRSRAWR